MEEKKTTKERSLLQLGTHNMAYQRKKSQKSETDYLFCDFPNCHKKFSRRDHLKRHKLNHDSNAKEYICQNCGLRSKRSDVMKAHMKRHVKQKQDEKQVLNLMRSKEILTSSDLLVNINNNYSLFNETTDQNLENFIDLDIELSASLDYPHLNFEYGLKSTLDDLLEADLTSIPTFDTNYKLITPEIMDMMLKLIPNLSAQIDFNAQTLVICLNCYWDIFHVQFPIIHKPSFNTTSTPTLLLFSMIMMGAVLSTSMVESDTNMLKDPTGLSNTIGEPLRWLVFQHRSTGASEPWELQSLLILEVFEKHYSTRRLNERSSIHQSTKIEMMKRSTLLGGDPYATESKSSTDLKSTISASGKNLLDRWIHAESMKRCALMAFCIDLNGTVVSSHSATLYVNKLRLGLPCDDFIWEADMDLLRAIDLPIKNPNMVLSELRRLLKGEIITTNSFGKRVMLFSLLSLIRQFEEKDETTILLMKSDSGSLERSKLRNLWKNKIAFAFDLWLFNVNEGNCCDINNSILQLDVRKTDQITKHFDLNDTKCKYPIYHMAHIYLQINNHDIFAFAGAPRRMAVETDLNDLKIIEQRLKLWANSLDGKVCVIHAYICTIECLMNIELNHIDYDPDKDPVQERPHVVIHMLLIIWIYNFIKSGPESSIYLSNQSQCYFKENSFHYLLRVKKEIDKYIKKATPVDYHLSLKEAAVNIDKIQNLHHIGGLMNQMSQLFAKCSWELGREYSRLLAHCCERSIGKQQVLCLNMYSV